MSRQLGDRSVFDRTHGPAVGASGDGLEGAYSAILRSAPSGGTVQVIVPNLWGLTTARSANCSLAFAGSPGDRVLLVFDEEKQPWVVSPTAVDQPGDLIASVARARTGCLLCDGTAYTLSVHPELTILASACPDYVSAGVLTVPDFRGRAPIGAGTGAGLTARSLGQSGGEETHVLADGEMPSHSHGGITGNDSPDHAHYSHDGAAFITVPEAGAYTYSSVYQAGVSNHTLSNNGGANYTSGAASRHAHGISADGGGAAHNNMQPFAVVNWFIKT
jgi:microcystin-dependent protein